MRRDLFNSLVLLRIISARRFDRGEGGEEVVLEMLFRDRGPLRAT